MIAIPIGDNGSMWEEMAVNKDLFECRSLEGILRR